MYSDIQFIFFDLGNVILNFDHEIGFRNVSKLTGLAPESVRQCIFETELQIQFETGQIDERGFGARFREFSQTDISTSELCAAVSDIFWVNRSIIPLLTQLSAARQPLGILSNTCEPHWRTILRRFPIIELLFPPERIVLSCRCHSMKPDPSIYRDAIQVASVSPEHIFFTDDRLDNVAAARKIGFQAEPFETTTQLIRWLIQHNIHFNI